MKIMKMHPRIGLYLGSYEVTCDHLHGILSISPNYRSSAVVGLLLTATEFGFPLGVPAIGSILYFSESYVFC